MSDIIKFRNFIPKEEELRHFIVTQISVSEIAKSIETEMNEKIVQSKNCLQKVSKNPTEPNWDLKREFASRNKRLDIQTARAIAKLAGKSVNEPMEDEAEVHAEIKKSVNVIDFDLSSDEDDDDWKDTKKLMSGLSKADADK